MFEVKICLIAMSRLSQQLNKTWIATSKLLIIARTFLMSHSVVHLTSSFLITEEAIFRSFCFLKKRKTLTDRTLWKCAFYLALCFQLPVKINVLSLLGHVQMRPKEESHKVRPTWLGPRALKRIWCPLWHCFFSEKCSTVNKFDKSLTKAISPR